MQVRCFRLLVSLALAVPAFAQSVTVGSSSFSNGKGAVWGTMHLSPRPFMGTPVTGAPYSAQRVSEHVQTAADGTRFTTNNQQETTYRDSQGRTRTERPIMMGPNAADAPVLVEISDPVSNVGYTLDTQHKIAHRYAFAALPGRQMAMAAAPIPSSGGGGGGGGRMGSFTGSVAPPPTLPAALPRPAMAREDLGSQMMEGVLVKGQRFVQSWPAGSQGSDRPFQTISETWTSPDLNLVVLSKNVDPRNGENTMKLINISRADPSPTLFAPPPDYTVVDETGPFEIQWTGKAQ
jgi:hypothetical protein